MSKKCVVLLSGGIDSTVLMYSLVADYECYPLTIDYGQRHHREVLAARNVCETRGEWLVCRWKYLDLGNLRTILPSTLTGVGKIPEGHYEDESMKQTVVPNRNMILLALAAGYAESIDAQCVAYAAHAGDHIIYPDCRPEFIDSVGATITMGTGGKVELIAPFVDKTKADIVKLGKTFTVPFKLTWSCYVGDDVHCGRCGTCIERREAFRLTKVEDPTEYAATGLIYKESYNKGRGLPEPIWGNKVEDLQCPNCSSQDMYASADPDDPEEIIGNETVRCKHCGSITDYYEAHEQRRNHPTDTVRGVVR